MIGKTNPIRSKKLMAASNGRPCSYCGIQDGTIVRAHYTGFRQHQYGKGRSIKGHDLIAADLCQSCHAAFDGMQMGDGETRLERSIDQSEKFLHCVALTLVADYHEGLLKT